MPRKANKPIDVFRYIDMHDGDRSVCWEWTASLGGRDKRPYFNINGQRLLSYRIVYEICHGVTISANQVVRHKCDNKICCNPDHLELGSHQENMNDMKERERHGLPHHAVRAIRKLLVEKRPHSEIAKLYGISRQLVTEINRGTVYQHVSAQDETGPE